MLSCESLNLLFKDLVWVQVGYKLEKPLWTINREYATYDRGPRLAFVTEGALGSKRPKLPLKNGSYRQRVVT